MYRRTAGQLEFEKFCLPFGGQLSRENRWARLSSMLPWDELESEYAEQFSIKMGAAAKSVRMALGALIIKEKLGISDEETVEQIRENPYLQCFIGLKEFTEQAPFDASMMVHFRKRFSLEMLKKLNERIVRKEEHEENTKDNHEGGESGQTQGGGSEKEVVGEEPKGPNRGKLLLDATCAPADIRYPTDLSLLNEAREKTERIIDTLYEPLRGEVKKPRTYRRVARKCYLKTAKSRKLSFRKRRKAIRQQLGYVERNLGSIDKLLNRGVSLERLSHYEYRSLLVISELYRQQRFMYDGGLNRIENRLVSISQPHVRPIVRGKAGKPTEFGAKLSASLVDGFVLLDRLSWDNFNESQDLVAQVASYRSRHGCYPASLHVDQIYRTRENRRWCQERGIRLSGPPLGRPPKNISRAQKKQAHEDQTIRNAIEGKFGQAKRRFSLNQIRAKLSTTSEAAIGMTFLVMNLQRCLHLFFILLFAPRLRTQLKEFGLTSHCLPVTLPGTDLRSCAYSF